MKNIFKKNQIIITALAIMIVIAGYLNFVEKKNDKATDVGTKDTIDYDTYKDTANDDITDGDLVTVEGSDLMVDNLAAGEETADAETPVDELAEGEDNMEDVADISDEDIGEVAQYDVADNGEVVVKDNEGEETSAPGEAILVSTTISPNFFASAKLEREQLRALNKERFNEIIDNMNLDKELKADAVAGLINLTQKAEKENETETLLEAKGFSDAIVTISDGSVDVIINAVTITEQDVAKIEDIVKRKTQVKASEIHISPVVMGD